MPECVKRTSINTTTTTTTTTTRTTSMNVVQSFSTASSSSASSSPTSPTISPSRHRYFKVGGSKSRMSNNNKSAVLPLFSHFGYFKNQAGNGGSTNNNSGGLTCFTRLLFIAVSSYLMFSIWLSVAVSKNSFAVHASSRAAAATGETPESLLAPFHLPSPLGSTTATTATTTSRFDETIEGAPQCSSVSPEEISFTLVIQLSYERLWMMEHHCMRWGVESPISIAVLTNLTKSEIRSELRTMGCDEQKVQVATLSPQLFPPDEYPVNVLRNMAIKGIKTSHGVYADSDFWASEDLHDTLNSDQIRKAMAQDPKKAIVIPAFQLNRQCKSSPACRKYQIKWMPKNYEDLVALLTDETKALPFDPTNYGAHGSTDYRAWIGQPLGDLLDIPCIRSNRYEPYLAFRYCDLLPPFQERFSGYGKNKLTWIMQLRRLGYTMQQLGGAFFVHYPHAPSKSRLKWERKPAEETDVANSLRGRVDKVFVEFRSWLQEKIPDQSRLGVCEEFEDEDQKLWIDGGNDGSDVKQKAL